MKRSLAAAGALSFALFLSACASDTTEPEGTSPAPMTETTAPEETTSPAETAAAEADIVETAEEAGNFTTLTAAIQAAGLEDDLKGPGPFTVFAPTDEAFGNLPEGTVDTLLEDPTGDLADILTYHVIPDEVMAAEVVELDGQKVATLQGAELTIEVEGDSVVLVDAAGNRVNVTATDVQASNGVIHVIDGVLLPTA